MSLHLLSHLSLPGDPAKPNEDSFAHADHAALVMDGATPLGDPLMPGPSDAAWLAQFGARRLMAHLKDDDAPHDALAHALADAEKSFSALARRPVRERWEIPCASMIMVTQAPEGQLECLWFGDCTALLLQGEVCTIIGDAFDKRGEESQNARRVAQEHDLKPAPDLNRPEILSHIRAGRAKVNSGSYWLFSPNPHAVKHVRHKTIKPAPGDLLLLASDGFLALATDYGAYDAKGLMVAARDKGLDALGEELRAIENDDALGETFARFKKSDDSTALLLEIA
jgi:serine/threonine protein phosphatase PrpC